MYLHQSTDIPIRNERVDHPMSLLIEWAQQFGRCHQELDSNLTIHCASYTVDDPIHPLIYCTTIEDLIDGLWDDMVHIRPQFVRHYHVSEKLTFLFYIDELGHYHAILECPDGQKHTLSWVEFDKF